jgi:hypothetical protein
LISVSGLSPLNLHVEKLNQFYIFFGGVFMKNFIFYSWQSDLPNSTNRGFIESCLSLAIKNLSNSKDFHLDLNLDRDTKEELGTPDIVNTIFKKIERYYKSKLGRQKDPESKCVT